MRASRALLLIFTVGASSFFVAPGTAAAEVPAGDQRSSVVAVEPASDVVRFSVVGGDEYLDLRAAPGHEVVVQGYAGEPYLRVRPDGTVDQNERSPAVVLNADRYGQPDAPVDVDGSFEPQWQVAGTDGTYRWHDHRIHSMVALETPVGQRSDWSVPITIDGSPHQVRGVLEREASRTGWGWALVLATLAAGFVAIGWRHPLPAARALAVVSAAAVVVATVGERAALGGLFVTGVGGWIVPLLATAAAVIAVAARTPRWQLIGAVAVPILELGWLLSRSVVLWRPVVVTAFPEPVQAGLVVVAASAAAAGAVLVVDAWRRLLPELTRSRSGARRSRGGSSGRSVSGPLGA